MRTDKCFAKELLAGLDSRYTHRVHDVASTRDPYHQRQWELCNAFSAVYDRLPFVSRLFRLQVLGKGATGKGKGLNARQRTNIDEAVVVCAIVAYGVFELYLHSFLRLFQITNLIHSFFLSFIFSFIFLPVTFITAYL